MPGEVFVEYQLELRQRLKEHIVFVGELANDMIWYVPTPKACEEGGYEPTATVVPPEAGGIIIQSTLDLIDKLCTGERAASIPR